MAGSSGTDYSQQDAAQVAVTDAVTNGTTTVTSATANFTTTHVGNVIYLGGTITATRRQVVTRVSATEITVDATVPAGTGVTLNLGGALDHVTTLAGAMVASNKAWVKAGTYNVAAVVTFGQAGVTPSRTVPPTHIIGYHTTRGDITPFTSNQANRPQILNTVNAINILNFTGSGWRIENLILGPSGVGACSVAIGITSYSQVVNVKVTKSASRGVFGSSGNNVIEFLEVTQALGGQCILSSANTIVYGCHLHDNVDTTPVYVSGGSGGLVTKNLIAFNSGSSVVGIRLDGGRGAILDNTIHASGSHGIFLDLSAAIDATIIHNNLLTENVGSGLYSSAAGLPASPLWDGNAYYSNGANRTNIDDTATNPVNGSGAYTNTRDVLLSADPFVSKATGDFRLNDTAGGGAAAKGAGVPNSWPGSTLTVGYRDFGAVQAQGAADTGGGGDYPDATDVRLGVEYGDGDEGTLVVPAAADVQFGVAVDDTTGTLVVPAVADVQSGVTYGAAAEFTGTFVSPAVGDVQSGVTYGASAEFTGTLTLPTEAQVEEGVTFGAGGTEFTGELTGEGLTLSQLQAELTTRGLDDTSIRTEIWANMPAGTPTEDMAEAVWAAASAGPSLDDIADHVWQRLLASDAFTTSLSIGKLIKDNLDAKVSEAGTGGDVVLAASQPNYAPAKAGDAMALTTGERASTSAKVWADAPEGPTPAALAAEFWANAPAGTPLEEIVAALFAKFATENRPALTSIPGYNVPPLAKIDLLYALARHLLTTDSGEIVLYGADGTTPLAVSPHSEASGTYNRPAWEAP